MKRFFVMLMLVALGCVSAPAQSHVEAPLLTPITVESTPSGAGVYGEDYVADTGSGYLGRTPLRLLLDPRRSHQFFVVMSGFNTAHCRLNPGQTRVTVDLSPSTPVGWVARQVSRAPLAAALLLGGVGIVVVVLVRRRRVSDESSTSAPDVSTTTRCVGDYEIVSRLGGGTDADVFRARHRSFGEEVALKILKRDGVDDEGLARFNREMEIGRDLRHPALVRVFGFGEVDGLPYLAMELLQGETLQARLSRGPLGVDEAIALGVRICEGLAACHARGIVHRDVKPTNIMLTADGGIRLLDFGVAGRPDRRRLTATGAPLGTPMYVAPEQVRGRPEPASDLYSLGVVLFEALAGRPPFDADDAIGLMMAHCSETPPRLVEVAVAVPSAMSDLVARLLDKDPRRRFASAEDAAAALRALAVSSEVLS